ncbi:hypothetical protein ACFLRX_03145 [Acidobacteriota bacterium]
MKNRNASPKLRMVSWNMARSQEAWDVLMKDRQLDIALLQEAVKPDRDIFRSNQKIEDRWFIQGYYKELCTSVVGLSDRVKVHLLDHGRKGESDIEKLRVSLPGTIAAAEVTIPGEKDIIVVSIYSNWEEPLKKKQPKFADASAHRIISDLSALVWNKKDQRIIIAGDWNIYFGYGDWGKEDWKNRYDTVFSRMDALGLKFIGPQFPNGIQAEPWPQYLPKDSKNVPTFRKHKNDPSTATDQLDFVFASTDIAERVKVKALNTPEEWGPSDHCRVLIELD